MLDAGVDGLAPGRKRGGVMLHPETVVADLGLTMLLGLAGAVGAWLLRRQNDLVGAESVSAGGRRRARARWRDRSSCMERGARACCRWCRRGWPARSWARDGDRATWAQARSFATTSSHGVGSGSPRLSDRDGERLYLRSQGELVRERPWPRSLAYVSMTALGKAGAAAAAGGRTARRAVRRDRCRQDHDRAAADRRADARTTTRRCWCSTRRATPRTSST